MKSRTHIAVLALALTGVMAASNANAIAFNLTGNFSGTGYAVVSFTTASSGIVDLLYTGGFEDPNLSLFDSTGAHLITNDDDYDLAISTYSHITQNLAAGSYSMLVSSCCEAYGHAYYDHGAVDVETDGYNNGSYLIGGTATLGGMQFFLDNSPYSALAGGEPFAMTITGDVANITAQVGTLSAVPESETYLMMLAGLGLVGALVRRRKY
jgi:PEP-CTERM motif